MSLRPSDVRDNYVLFQPKGLFGEVIEIYEYEMERYTINGVLNSWHNDTIQIELLDFYYDQWEKHHFGESN